MESDSPFTAQGGLSACMYMPLLLGVTKHQGREYLVFVVDLYLEGGGGFSYELRSRMI